MLSDIADTLLDLDSWYNELSGGNDRPKLLAKLAILEVCGWLELRMDEIIREAGRLAGVPDNWVESYTISKTYGFKYGEHFRPMLCDVLGAGCVKHIEAKVSPAKIDALSSQLGTLWSVRSSLAHTHTAGRISQQTINAPSWCINQHRVLGRQLEQLEASVVACATAVTRIVF
jgi:hypothetical protein